MYDEQVGKCRLLFLSHWMPENKIHGGYYLKARQINNSLIAHAPPHVREIWDWLIKSAQHKPYKASNKIIGRGQVLTTYEEIAAGLYWMIGFVKKTYKKHHIDFSMRWLRNEQMITTQKTTRGFIVSICNYAFYQDPTNYDYDYQNAMITTPLRQGTDTINKNVKNDKNENNTNIINSASQKGALAAPLAPIKVSGYNQLPDGRSYIEPDVFFTSADFNGLPDDKNEHIRGLLKEVKKVDVETEGLSRLWEIFKGMQLTFQKPYRNKDDVYNHFSNWCKKQPFAKGARATAVRRTSKTKDEKVIGMEFINDFTQCRMSDGSTHDLNKNESDSAKYNLINPSSIVKKG